MEMCATEKAIQLFLNDENVYEMNVKDYLKDITSRQLKSSAIKSIDSGCNSNKSSYDCFFYAK